MVWNVSKAEFNVWGRGMEDCGEMVTNYNNGDEGLRFSYTHYITGVITGMMMATNNTSDASNHAIILETYNYCKENPLEKFYWAIAMTFNKLVE